MVQINLLEENIKLTLKKISALTLNEQKKIILDFFGKELEQYDEDADLLETINLAEFVEKAIALRFDRVEPLYESSKDFLRIVIITAMGWILTIDVHPHVKIINTQLDFGL